MTHSGDVVFHTDTFLFLIFVVLFLCPFKINKFLVVFAAAVVLIVLLLLLRLFPAVWSPFPR